MTNNDMCTDGTDRRDPADEPTACSKCGVYIGMFAGKYCDPCAREIGQKPPMQRCMGCGQRAPEEQMDPVDVSGPEEYYPKFEYLCPDCSGGDA